MAKTNSTKRTGEAGKSKQPRRRRQTYDEPLDYIVVDHTGIVHRADNFRDAVRFVREYGDAAICQALTGSEFIPLVRKPAYVVLLRGEVVHDSPNQAGIVEFLKKSGSPHGALVLRIWTPGEFCQTAKPEEPMSAAAVATGKKTNGRK